MEDNSINENKNIDEKNKEIIKLTEDNNKLKEEIKNEKRKDNEKNEIVQDNLKKEIKIDIKQEDKKTYGSEINQYLNI